MNHPFAEIVWINGTGPRTHDDPRVPIARHIGWKKSYTPYTEYSTPEPDNYNHGILLEKPILCDFIRDQVVYRRAKLGHWWTMFVVPEEQEAEFITWLHTLQVIVYWYAPRAIKPKERKPHLWSKKTQAELTDNERLYTMGYYKNLESKYFTEDNKELSLRIGNPRADINSTVPVID